LIAQGVSSAETRIEVASGEWLDLRGGYYADDLLAIQGEATSDGHFYAGAPVSPGHGAVRSASVALGVRLSDLSGATAWGDVCTPQYSGFSGRDLPIHPPLHGPQVTVAVAALAAAGPVTFASGCALIEDLQVDGRQLHTGVRYGVSQALLGLASQRAEVTPAELLAELFGTDELVPVPLYAQSGEDRHGGVDKMIMKRVDVLPHGLINAPALFGDDGSRFLDYAGWVRDRVLAFGPDDYRPLLHFDVYGLPGLAFERSTSRMVELFARLVERCQPLRVQLESPVYGSSGDETRDRLAELRAAIRGKDLPLALVADDWCNGLVDIQRFAEAAAVDVVQIKMPDLGALTNALTAARTCRDHGVGVFIGGSCTETEVSARHSAHVALGVQADQVLGKPGMGVDEGVLVVGNEMRRTLHTAHRRHVSVPTRTVSASSGTSC
jgi:methylaspartate ammonia-lyase